MISKDDKCQITAAPKDINPEDLATRGEQIAKSSGIITENQQTIKHTAKLFVKEANENDKVNFTSTMSSKCSGKPIEIVKEKEVPQTLFSQMDNGSFVDSSSLGESSEQRIKRAFGCSSTRVNVAHILFCFLIRNYRDCVHPMVEAAGDGHTAVVEYQFIIFRLTPCASLAVLTSRPHHPHSANAHSL